MRYPEKMYQAVGVRCSAQLVVILGFKLILAKAILKSLLKSQIKRYKRHPKKSKRFVKKLSLWTVGSWNIKAALL
jgi:hypothetical protein